MAFDIYQVRYENLKLELTKGLFLFHAEHPTGWQVWAMGSTYGLTAVVGGADKVDFDANLVSISRVVQDEQEAIGLNRVDSKLERDGRSVIAVAPNPEGWKSYYSGAGDTTSGARVLGGGQRILETFAGPDTKTITIQYREPVELHDGEAFWRPLDAWDVEDYFDLYVSIPATPATANGSNTGNANKVALGGGAHMFVPAAGNGAWNIDLATAVPVPSETKQGYFDVNRDTGAVSVSSLLGHADWMLFDFPLTIYFLRKISMGSPLGVFDVDAYKTQWISERWQIKIEITKVTTGAGKFGGWLLAYRRNPS